MRYLFLVLFLSSCIQPSKEKPTQALNPKTQDCSIYIVNTIEAQTSVVGSDIFIRDTYWAELDKKARYVTLLRETLHCEYGYPYLEGISVMNRKITLAMAAYEYGAN